jgi:hypothetical protein
MGNSKFFSKRVLCTLALFCFGATSAMPNAKVVFLGSEEKTKIIELIGEMGPCTVGAVCEGFPFRDVKIISEGREVWILKTGNGITLMTFLI